jgi:hypothetical protein
MMCRDQHRDPTLKCTMMTVEKKKKKPSLLALAGRLKVAKARR